MHPMKPEAARGLAARHKVAIQKREHRIRRSLIGEAALGTLSLSP